MILSNSCLDKKEAISCILSLLDVFLDTLTACRHQHRRLDSIVLQPGGSIDSCWMVGAILIDFIGRNVNPLTRKDRQPIHNREYGRKFRQGIFPENLFLSCFSVDTVSLVV